MPAPRPLLARPPRRLPMLSGAAALILGATLLTTAPATAVTSAADAEPDRVVLTPAQDASTSQSFTWRTGADVLDGSVSIRLAGSSETWRVVEATANEPLANDGIPTRSHSVTVDGLQPSTEYEYFVGNADATSETWTFTTAGEPGDPFTFLYFGDAQNELDSTWRPVVEQAYAKYPDAVGTVNAGDLINNSNDTEWTQWFAGMDGFSQTSNVIAAPGNHEYSDDSFLLNWKSNFEYPGNGPSWDGEPGETAAERQEAAYREHMAEVITETAYYTDYQGVRFIALNASRSQARELFTPDDLPPCLIGCPDPVELWLDLQAGWLDHILSTNPNTWAVATFHQPVFSTAVGRDEVDVRAAWLPVFQRNDIDLVLMGHDHTYARGFVNSDATETPGITTGPVYTVAVAGPKYYDQQPEDDNVWTRNGATQVVRAGSTSTFQGITVDGGTLRYEATVAAKWDGDEASTTDVPVGGVLDSFTITKYDDGSKYVTEDGVAIPEPGEGPDPVDPPVDPPVDEEPAEDPADVPLGHVVVGGLTAPTVAEPGPSAYDPRAGILYVGDQSAEGTGRVEAVDVATDEVLRSFDVGAPITDMAFEPSEGGMLVIGFGDDDGHAANGFSVAPAAFGTTLLDEHIEMPAAIRGVGFDAGSAMVYFALDNGFIVAVDVDEGAIAGQHPVGENVRRMKVDPATGNLYVTFDGGDAGELRIYAGRSEMSLLREFPLDGGARSVDLDPAQGLAYVGHAAGAGAGGISVVDVIDETVARSAGDGFGVDVEAVSVDRDRGLVYVTSSSGTPDPVVVVGRLQAPRILTSPVPVTVEAGEPATFEASAWGIPTPTATWQSRAAGSDAWTPVEGATGAKLVVDDGADGTQYRALFTNEIDGNTYSTASATATLTVTGEDPGEEPGDGKPTGTPTPVDPSELTDATRGGVTATLDGRHVTLRVGAAHGGEWIGVYLHSEPEFLGWFEASSTGAVTFHLADDVAGEHRLVALDADGALIGWAPIELAAAPSGGLASTGAAPAGALIAALVLLLGGAAVVLLRRRRAS